MPTDSAASRAISTGISGLDNVLAGGLPRDRLYLVEGYPGTGKTTLALQFLMAARDLGESALYITLSETKDELRDVAQSHGWSLDGIALVELESIDQGDAGNREYTVFHPAEIELGETTARILAQVEKIQPTRVVFDSLSEMRLLAQGPLRYRREILALKQFFAGRKCTVLLLDDRTAQEDDLQLQSISHGVIRLDRVDADYGSTRRRLHVVKMRGVRFRDGYHDYQIETGGLAVYPRLVASEHRPAAKIEKVSSGLESLDALLGGGIERGSSSLIMGPAGAGKSTIATQLAVAACGRGETVACYAFEESADTFLQRATGMGMPVDQYLDSKLIRLQQIDPAELSPGQFAFQVRRDVEEHGARVVLIDSLNGYLNAMPNDRFLLIQMHEMLTYLAQQGVITLMILAQHGLMGHLDTPVEISYLADTLISLRYFEVAGEVRQALSVVKKRKGAHERTIRELRFSAHGISVGPPLADFDGVLTGVPRFRGQGQWVSQAQDHEAER